MTSLAVSPQIKLQNNHTLVYDTIELFQDYLPLITEVVKKSLVDVVPLACIKYALYMNPLSKILKITCFALSVLGMWSIIIETDKSEMKKSGAFKIDALNSNAELKKKVIEEFNKLIPLIDFDQSIQILKIEQAKIEKKLHLKNVDIYIAFNKCVEAFALRRAIFLPLVQLPFKKKQNDLFVYILFHELAHIKHKHLFHRDLFYLILKTVSLAGSLFVSSYLWLGLPLLNNALMLCFYRKQELEADLTAAKSMGTKEFIQVMKQHYLDNGKSWRKNYNPHYNPSVMQRVVNYISPGSLWCEWDKHGNNRKATLHPTRSDTIRAVKNQK